MANIPGSMLSTLLRGGVGIGSKPAVTQPKKLLKLYDIENCPYCRLVREALTELSLDAEIYPCPKQGERYRPWVVGKGGKAQFPFLVDPNTGVEMYESLDIVEYLFTTYGDRKLPLKWRAGALQTFGSMLASAPRVTQGMQADTGTLPERMLELYSFESSPYARVVRERLCELELPYILRNCGRTEVAEWLLPGMRETLDIVPKSAGKNRRALQQKEGKVAIPYLHDPNTGEGMFESSLILNYLNGMYS